MAVFKEVLLTFGGGVHRSSRFVNVLCVTVMFSSVRAQSLIAGLRPDSGLLCRLLPALQCVWPRLPPSPTSPLRQLGERPFTTVTDPFLYTSCWCEPGLHFSTLVSVED